MRSFLRGGTGLMWAALTVTPMLAQRIDLGPPSYELQADGANVRLTVRVTNQAATASAALRVELWAFAVPFDLNRPSQSGYRLATVNLAALVGGAVAAVDQLAAYTAPPAGPWNLALLATENNGTGTFVLRAGVNFLEGLAVPQALGSFSPVVQGGFTTALRTSRLMVDGSQVYFITPDTGTIRAVNTTSGTFTNLFTSANAVQNPVTEIAQDNAFIYFLRGEGLAGTLQKVPKPGGAVTTLVPSALNAVAPVAALQGLAIAPTGGRLYLNFLQDEPGPGGAFIGLWGGSISTLGGAATVYDRVVGGGRDTRTWICTDFSNVYWVNLNQGASIRHRPLIGGAVTTDVPSLPNGAAFLSAPSGGAAKGSLFWVEGAVPNRVLRRFKAGVVIPVANIFNDNYAVDGDRVYFVSRATLRLSWASIEGGPETPLLPLDANLIGEIVTNGNAIYWIAQGLDLRVSVNRLVLPVHGAPRVTLPPLSQQVAPGASVTLNALAAGGGVTYVWSFNGSVFTQPTASASSDSKPGRAAAVVAGTTNSPTLVLNNVTAADMGFYSCVMTNSAGSTEPAVAIVTVDTGGPSRLINLSTRGQVQAGTALTPGFVMKGTGAKQLLVRAVGPTLSVFGLAALGDTKMEVINQQTGAQSAANDDWNAPLADTFSSLGAFALGANSKDAATLSSLPVNQGGYTVRITASGGATSGLALAEVYDADPITASAKLANVSTLGFAGTGADALTPGFVIGGTAPKLLLIRAVGPGLAPFGVAGTLADPRLSVIPLGMDLTVASNDDWGGTTALKEAFGAAGAFSIPDGTKDAAVVVRLPPGGYSVVVSGANNSTGSVLVEVYDLDP